MSDAKKIVLTRRARFIAAAIASAGLASCDSCRPEPCLAQAERDARLKPVPEDVPLGGRVVVVDASADAPADASVLDGGAPSDAGPKDAGPKDGGSTTKPVTVRDAAAHPMSCLSPWE